MLTLFDASILRLITVYLIPLLCTEFTAVELFSLHIAMARSQMHRHLLVLSQGGYKMLILFLSFKTLYDDYLSLMASNKQQIHSQKFKITGTLDRCKFRSR